MGRMKINVKINCSQLARAVLAEKLEALGVRHEFGRPGELILCDEIEPDTKEKLSEILGKYGIEILEDKHYVLVERIKNAIDTMLRSKDIHTEKVSDYLADQLNYSYSYLSEVFSETTFTSVENYVILRKVDIVKDLIAETDLNLTEIAFRLDYSSVAHLSAQFKKTTGLTPTAFRQIIKKRKEQAAG